MASILSAELKNNNYEKQHFNKVINFEKFLQCIYLT